jgi:hypothetical protein
MKSAFIIFIIILSFNACKRNKTIEEIITNNSYKYWQVEKIPSERSKAEIIYYFDKTGKWLVFQRTYTHRKFNKLDRGDVFFIETWELINNNTIAIGTVQYQIEKIEDDEFIFLGEEGYKRKLIAAPDSIIPLEYKKLQ